MHALRSAYLYYFSHFIEWPQGTPFPSGKLELCALTDNEEDRYQLNTIDNKSLGQIQLRITILAKTSAGVVGDYSYCHMLFVSAPYRDWLQQKRDTIADYTLLVTEGDQQETGAVHLFMHQKKLKFEIDIQSLHRRQFKASSKLLRLSMQRGSDE